MRIRHLTLLCCVACALPSANAQDYWNQFRGARGDGVATSAVSLPVEFDEAKNVHWKTAIPGQGWSSPVVWGNEVWLTTGSDEKRELRTLCVDLKTGSIVKNIKVFDMIDRKVDPAYVHDSPHLNSPATPTPVVEADRVFVSFGSQGIASLDRRTGKTIWERRDLRIYQPVRQGSSPIVDDQNLYVAYDGTDQQFFVALDKRTGDTRWKTDRNVKTDWEATLRQSGLTPKKGGGKPNDNKKSFATATIIEVNGQRQLIAPAAEATIAYNPDNGDELWRALHPGGFNVAARPIHAHGMVYVFTSGLTGYLMGIRTDGEGDVTDTHVAWSTKRGTPHIPSPIVNGDLLFTVSDKGGIVRCLEARTGAEVWRTRIGGNHWASPIQSGGHLFFSSKEGEVVILPATRTMPEITHRNKLNARFIASPAVAGSALILRSTTHLYCLREGQIRTAAQVAADVYPEAGPTGSKKPTAKTDWDAAYARLLKSSPEVRKKVENGDVTKKQIIAWMMRKQGGKGAKGGKGGGKTDPAGRQNFYAIVIGRLRTKDIELGELTMDVDYAISGNKAVNQQITGKRIRLVGVAGQFLDNLLQLKRGETFKVRAGSYDPTKKELGFGYKFQVLERTAPFKPEDFGVPSKTFRGFCGMLTGKIVESAGYELLVQVSDAKPDAQSRAADASAVLGKRIRIAGFYNEHRKLYAELHEGDVVRVSVHHRDPTSDALNVTDTLEVRR